MTEPVNYVILVHGRPRLHQMSRSLDSEGWRWRAGSRSSPTGQQYGVVNAKIMAMMERGPAMGKGLIFGREISGEDDDGR
jgi:hypothetical protein